MGFSRNYLKPYNFVLTKITGDINDAELLQHVKALNRETRGISELRELADCRELTSVSALTAQGTTLAASAEEYKPGSLGVILVPKEKEAIYGMARAYQMFAEEHRESVMISRDLDEALNWLTKDNSAETEVLRAFIDNT